MNAGLLLFNCSVLLFHFQMREMLDRTQSQVDRKVKVNMQSPKKRETALHFACRGHRLDSVKFLVENGADVNLRGIYIEFSKVLKFSL